MRSLSIGELVARVPIIQGGMGVGISMAGLASAVANAGGIGVIATAGVGMAESDFYSNFLESNMRALRQEIRKARAATRGILGVNIMVALTNYADLVKTAIEEKIDIIFSGAGMPMNLPQYRPADSKTKLVPIVSSGRAAGMLCKRWKDKFSTLPDAIVVEGPMAGGHLGFKQEQLDSPEFALEKLVVDVIEAMRPFAEQAERPIPVIAAGGIYSGADILKFEKLGTAGVQMGTRFVATHECDASDGFKQAYVKAKQEDLTIIKSPVGMPGRALRNGFIEAIERGERVPISCPYHCILTCTYPETPYCIAIALQNAKRGNLKYGFAFAGANAYRVTEVISVAELIESLEQEYEAAVEALA